MKHKLELVYFKMRALAEAPKLKRKFLIKKINEKN